MRKEEDRYHYNCSNYRNSPSSVYGNCNTTTYEIEYLEPIDKYLTNLFADSSSSENFIPQSWQDDDTYVGNYLHDKVVPDKNYKLKYKEFLNIVRLFSNNNSPVLPNILKNSPFTGTSRNDIEADLEDTRIRAQIIFEGTKNFNIEDSIQFEQDIDTCSQDIHKGKLDYPEDGKCKWEQDSPPISDSSEWLEWIKSSNAITFVREKIGENLFRGDKRYIDGNEVNNPSKIPNNCEKLKTKFNYKNLGVGDEIYVKKANPNFLLINQEHLMTITKFFGFQLQHFSQLV